MLLLLSLHRQTKRRAWISLTLNHLIILRNFTRINQIIIISSCTACGQDLLEKQKINGGNIKFLKIHINQISIVYKGQRKEQLSGRSVVDLCFLKTLFQSVFLFFETMQLHTNNKLNSTTQ